MPKVVLDDGNLKRIHVNQHIIRSNAKNEESEPVYTVKYGKNVFKAKSVSVNGELEFVYRPEKPLSCGAKCWGETRGRVTLQV